ncbi:MAG TPA: PQQ-dependent sugar dehydrogenase [Thermoleophilaceae bacterium]|nr:PQQ-dependent sugar dehydrogenase [Thermoleophilaceae bacterium]
MALFLGICGDVDAIAAIRFERVARFEQPLYVTAPRSEARRVFVVERAGRIRVLRSGRKLERPFLDIRRSVRFLDRRDVTRDQGGLLSLAFAPDYHRSGRFYVFYTHSDRMLHVDEFRRSKRNPGRASAASRRTVLTVRRTSGNDLGGQLQFGPEGLLYIGLGYGRDPRFSADLSRLEGKILRIDPRRAGGRPYRIPTDNPFVMRPGARPEVYAYGLRNPYRFSFDRRTGDLAIADPGESRTEEIDFVRRGAGAGANFGWPVFEGRQRVRAGSAEGHLPPVLTKRHPVRGCRAVIGGYVVRARNLRRERGRYLYGELCTGQVRSVRLRRPRAVGDRDEGLRVVSLVSFGEDGRGGLYAVSLGGSVFRVLPR